MVKAGIGLREHGGGGPSAMSLYANTDSADLGHATASELDTYKLSQQQKYAMPLEGTSTSRPSGAPEWYNYRGMLPAKYDIPTDAKDFMDAKQSLREAVPKTDNGVVRTDPITDYEVEYVRTMKRQAELADFDRYINKLIDPRKPGNLKWLMEVYPEFVHRRIAQVHDDYDFAIRNQMIDSWGINTLDDLHFKYLVDQGKISGGTLNRRKAMDEQYKVGILAPSGKKALAGEESVDDALVLPFESSDGKTMRQRIKEPSYDQPLGKGARDYTGLARSMFTTQARENRKGWFF